MASTQHYVWAAGHFVLLTAALYLWFAALTFRSIASASWYKAAYTGSLVSYGIVCYKSLGVNSPLQRPSSGIDSPLSQTPQLNGSFVRKALTDENVQYFLLAIFWWTSKPVALSLVPYAIFSLFHALTFLRTTVLPLVFPPTPPPAGATGGPQQSAYAKMIQSWVRANYDKAMRFVAYAELIILARVLLGVLVWQNSIAAPIVYAHFLRQRYYFSQFSRDAIHHASSFIDSQLHRAPPVVGTGWGHIKTALTKWTGTVIAPQAPPATSGNGGNQRRASRN